MDVLKSLAYHNFSVSKEDASERLRPPLKTLVENHDMREHGKANARPARSISDDLKRNLGDRFAIARSPEKCRAKLDVLSERGVDAVYHGFPIRDGESHARRFEDAVLC